MSAIHGLKLLLEPAATWHPSLSGDVPVNVDSDSASRDVQGVIITGDLDRRPSRAPDYEAENRALASLAEAMSTSPATVLQRLVEAVIELTGCDSAGISLLESGGAPDTFRWAATAGTWAPYRDGTMPREQSPCGEVIARQAVLLMSRPERAFPALLQAEPAIGEGLLAPFSIDGAPAGTVWAIMHRAEGRFEAEDARLLKSLERFASAAHQMTLALSGARANEQKIEARYQTLFDSIDEGFVEMEMVMDDDGKVIDWRWIDFNPAFERMSGLKGTKGQLFSEVVPELEPEWAERYGHVIATGESLRFELPVGGLDKWFDAFVSRIGGEGSRRLIVVFNNITARKRAEETLRESEQQQAFLLKLSDALRALADPIAIQEVAARILGEHLDADRTYYAVVKGDYEAAIVEREYLRGDAPSVVGTHPFAAFGSVFDAFRNGRAMVVDDLDVTDAIRSEELSGFRALSIRSIINVPLVKGDRSVAGMNVLSVTPRKWTAQQGAPPPPASVGPRRVGFGSELIEGRIPYELEGRGKVTIEPGGARCELEFPLMEGASVLETDAPKLATVFGGAIDLSGQSQLSGHHVLVLEDDYYIATDTARALRGAGAEIIGPCPNEAAARDAIKDTVPTCAVVDINLGTGPSFALAGELKRDGVPFVFITGYGQEVIPDQFAGVTRLQKPFQFKEIVGALADTIGKARHLGSK